VLDVRHAVVPLFHKYAVDLVINGHDHEYERSKALAGPPDAPTFPASGGTVYVICAGAGANAFPPSVAGAPFREKAVGFGSGTAFTGVYALLTLERNRLTWAAYGLTASGADTQIDAFSLAR
jgi:hypothetical protein